MGHVRSFDEDTIAALFPALRIAAMCRIGVTAGYAPDWLYAAAQRLGDVWQQDCFDVERGQCPACRRPDAAVQPTLFGELLARVIWRIERAALARPMWILALLEKP
jgi:hypothetical protein